MSDDLLTKDNFNYQYSGDMKHWNWELAHHPRYTNPWTEQEAKEIRDKILKNQEIVEILKNRIYFHGMQGASDNTAPIQDAILSELQIILEGNK